MVMVLRVVSEVDPWVACLVDMRWEERVVVHLELEERRRHTGSNR